MSTGKTYEISGETTEWEDIMIKKGIKTKDEIFIEKGLNPDDVSLLQRKPYATAHGQKSSN